MVLEAVLCNDGVYRIPPENVEDVERWRNGYLVKVIPFMWEYYKNTKTPIVKEPYYFRVTVT